MTDANTSGLEGANVLVVDDNPENLRVLQEMLSEQGCEIRVARDGRQALRSVEAAPPDMILLDIHMPEMDGYEVCRRLKADSQFSDIPIIFISALGETFNKVTAYECGAADYVTKPFQFEEVCGRMKAHLRMRNLLATTEAGFRSSFEQAAVGMAHLSLEGVFLRVNRRLCEMLGYPEEELTGRSIADVLCREFRASDRSGLQRIIDGEQESMTEEQPYFRKGGDALWCRTTLSLIEVPATRERYLAAIIEDISERRRAEEERRQLAAAIDQAVEGIVITDRNGATLYANSSWKHISGCCDPQIAGAEPCQFPGEDGDETPLRRLWEAAVAGTTSTGRLTSTGSDGSTLTVEVTVSPVRDQTGDIANIVAIARDISEQIALEDRFRQAQKLEAIGTLAGGIAHDFNNILSAVMGYTDIAINEVPEDSRAQSSLSQVAVASERARDLVAQILAFSRQSERETRPVQVQSIAKEALKLLRGSIPSTIEIRADISGDCAPVLADPTGIHQLLMNLCTNAYHAMREKGGVLALRVLQVELREDECEHDPELSPGKYVRLEVCDTGHGMDAETRARIFEPYFTTKERGEGTGLGLSTIHGIVTDLDGVIHVYSEPGEGTAFTVLLPCVSGEQAKKEASSKTLESLKGTERVLLVDDEQAIIEFAKAALRRLGYKVTSQASSTAALELFSKDPNAFDVVVTDQMMPHMKGTELGRRIHDMRPDIPVVMCSGFAETIRETSGDEDSIQCHVMKPIIGADLSRAIRGVMDKG